MKILSWNIRQGGGTRHVKILKAIQEIKPDIIALNEWHNNAVGIQIRSSLLRLGFQFQITSAAPSSVNSAFIASKHPCSSSLFKGIDKEYSNNVVVARFEAFDLYSVYLPHKKKHRLFEWLIEEELSDVPAIIVGDFNTGYNYIDQAGNSFWYTDELMRLEDKGYIDAFRYLHGSKSEYSWYSHQGNGYRYDHSYVSKDITSIVSKCEYLHQYREDGLSDHSPMLLVLGT